MYVHSKSSSSAVDYQVDSTSLTFLDRKKRVQFLFNRYLSIPKTMPPFLMGDLEEVGDNIEAAIEGHRFLKADALIEVLGNQFLDLSEETLGSILWTASRYGYYGRLQDFLQHSSLINKIPQSYLDRSFRWACRQKHLPIVGVILELKVSSLSSSALQNLYVRAKMEKDDVIVSLFENTPRKNELQHYYKKQDCSIL